MGFGCLSPLLGWSQGLSEKERKALGKHAHSVEAKAKALGLVLDYDQPPKPVKLTKPKYPVEALRGFRDGRVLVMVVVDTSGRVSDVEILESTPGFGESALACARSWVFKPALKNGQAVRTVVTGPISYDASR
jgi:TonB family protein